MMIYYDPDRFETFSTSHTCGFHKYHPREPYAGCTCGATIGTRQVSEEEYRRRRAKRSAASADTLPEGQDAKQGLAGTEGSAVANGETPTPSSAQPGDA